MSRTVAITGATGFIGRRAAHRLAAAGWNLRLLLRRPDAAGDLPAATIVPGRLEDTASLERLVQGVDAVLHLAGLVKARSRAAFFAANRDGTRRLVEAMAGQPAPRPHLLLVSSLAAREPHLSAYAASKQAAESLLDAADSRLSWTILRPSAVYGPGDREILPMFRAAAAGFAPMLAGPDARLSMLYVDDLVAALAALLESAPSGATLEIDDGRPGGYSWPELVAAAAAAVGTKPVRFRVPAAGLRLAALLARAGAAVSFRPAMLTAGKAREILHADWVVRDSHRLPAPDGHPAVGIEEGFRRTVEWYRGHGWLPPPPRRRPM